MGFPVWEEQDNEDRMEYLKAVEILEKYNVWRRDDRLPPKIKMPDPVELGRAIDLVVNTAKKNNSMNEFGFDENNPIFVAMRHDEYHMQSVVCQYIDQVYPDVLFLSDTIGNVKLTKMQAVRNKAIQKPGFKCPDILILEPNKEYHGLFIELKTKSPYKRDGGIYKNEHLEGQERSINELIKKGFRACFSWTVDMTIEIIDEYMSNR